VTGGAEPTNALKVPTPTDRDSARRDQGPKEIRHADQRCGAGWTGGIRYLGLGRWLTSPSLAIACTARHGSNGGRSAGPVPNFAACAAPEGRSGDPAPSRWSTHECQSRNSADSDRAAAA
jgi:hypothetical protein